MSSENTPSFAVYNLRNSFSEEPKEINNCPICENLLLKFNIPPSKAIIDQVRHHSGFDYDYSHLYECPSCKWWAIRESWLDIGVNGWYDFLIVGKKPDEKDSAWRQILENVDIYSEETTMPDTIKQLFTQKDRTNYFVVRQPLGISPPLCVQGSQGVIVRNNEYTTQYVNQLKGWDVSEDILLDDIVKRAMLHEAQAALESGTCYAVRLQHVMTTEAIEKFGLCKVDEIYLFDASNLEKLPKS